MTRDIWTEKISEHAIYKGYLVIGNEMGFQRGIPIYLEEPIERNNFLGEQSNLSKRLFS